MSGGISSYESRFQGALTLGLFALLALSPLPFGSVEPGWMLAIELNSVVLAAGTLWLVMRSEHARIHVPFMALGAILFLIAVSLLQVAPIPGLSAALEPAVAKEARSTLASVEPATAVANAPQSASPPNTLDAVVRVIAYGLVALAAGALLGNSRAVERFAWLVAGMGALEALYGAAEYLSGHQHIFGYTKRYYLDEATGTFVNRNHFAGYLAMTLPFALALAIRSDASEESKRGWRERLIGLTRGRGAKTSMACAAAACIWVGIFLSYSRGGLLAALTGTASFALLSLRRRRMALKIAITALVPAFALLWLSIRAPGERFLDLPAEAESGVNRLMVAKTSVGLIADEPLLGYGFGTFESVFRLRKPLADRFVFDHAHSEPMQFVVEGGLLLMIPLSLLLAALAVQSAAFVRRSADTGFGAALLASLAAVATQSFVDFPLRIPAIALLASTCGGALLFNRLRTEMQVFHGNWGRSRSCN